MAKDIIHKSIVIVFLVLSLWACKTSSTAIKTENKSTPASYNNLQDSTNSAKIKWKDYFTDQNLSALIDTALKNNQELNITLQEIEISKNEVKTRKGEYLPFVNIGGGTGIDKGSKFTRNGIVDENINIQPGTTAFPDPMPDFMLGISASWELDIWKKLRNAKKASVAKYLSSVEGKNFMLTNLIAEIASSYYELIALDNQMEIVQKNIEIQSNVLQTIIQQKEAAKVTQLAVNRFEAQLLNTQNLQYEIQQKITETENKLNFLVGRFPQPVQRTSKTFNDIVFDTVYEGLPSQLLENRPDIRQAELELTASKLDVKVAKANFYPSIGIKANVGYQAFNPNHLVDPESMFFSLAGDLVAPLINRNAIKAVYFSANAKQIQAVYNYERTILNAYVEVVNELSKINNFAKSYQTKSNEVEILSQSITISNNLFKSARADYMEVLLTQREALESRMELIEIKMKQMNAKINMYKALGGGWN
jgi:NodT family efflux transporter outer membrane factor (OMF) lipoprotein